MEGKLRKLLDSFMWTRVDIVAAEQTVAAP
jgi:hypothetical protein